MVFFFFLASLVFLFSPFSCSSMDWGLYNTARTMGRVKQAVGAFLLFLVNGSSSSCEVVMVM